MTIGNALAFPPSSHVSSSNACIFSPIYVARPMIMTSQPKPSVYARGQFMISPWQNVPGLASSERKRCGSAAALCTRSSAENRVAWATQSLQGVLASRIWAKSCGRISSMIVRRIIVVVARRRGDGCHDDEPKLLDLTAPPPDGAGQRSKELIPVLLRRVIRRIGAAEHKARRAAPRRGQPAACSALTPRRQRSQRALPSLRCNARAARGQPARRLRTRSRSCTPPFSPCALWLAPVQHSLCVAARCSSQDYARCRGGVLGRATAAAIVLALLIFGVIDPDYM